MQQASRCIQQRMRRLAERPHTDVLEYAYDAQDREADAVTCVKLFERAAEVRRSLAEEDTTSPAGIRRAVLREDPSLEDFARNFPAIFKNALDLENYASHSDVLKKLARLRKEVEAGGMSEAEANVHATRIVLEKTMRAPTDEEKKEHGFRPCPQCPKVVIEAMLRPKAVVEATRKAGRAGGGAPSRIAQGATGSVQVKRCQEAAKNDSKSKPKGKPKPPAHGKASGSNDRSHLLQASHLSQTPSTRPQVRLTKFERTHLLGARACELAAGREAKVPCSGILDPLVIACLEFERGVLDLQLIRTYPGGRSETVSVKDEAASSSFVPECRKEGNESLA